MSQREREREGAGGCVGEKEDERERDREREEGRQTYGKTRTARETDRQTDRETDRQTDRQTDRETRGGWEGEIEENRERDTQSEGVGTCQTDGKTQTEAATETLSKPLPITVRNPSPNADPTELSIWHCTDIRSLLDTLRMVSSVPSSFRENLSSCRAVDPFSPITASEHRTAGYHTRL